ncbi:hypothetical protein KMT30_36185 [Streptomyces sp. IBSBF 2953]|nr:hypothetical protein [Streptomyces hayashii]
MVAGVAKGLRSRGGTTVLTRRRSGSRVVAGGCETGGRMVPGSLAERGVAV